MGGLRPLLFWSNMKTQRFTEEDKQKVVDFLNMVANHADLKLNTSQLIRYFKLLSFMQQELLPKIDANTFEIKKVVQTNKEG